MKTGIHPAYHQVTVSCACGNSFQVGSTMKDDMRVEICANCHPLYTGKTNLIDTAGRIDKFQERAKLAQQRQEAIAARTAAKQARQAEKTEAEAAK